MLSVIPALALTLVSFMCSAFIVLRIVIPILPPHPLSKRVSPAEFGLPTFRALSASDKSHLWLAALDLVSISVFMWQVVNESSTGPSGYAMATDPASAIRLWIIVTVRQSCLLIIAFITLLHVRMAHPISFGGTQWMLWAPTLLLTCVSTAIAGVLASSGVESLFYGLTAYASSIAFFTAIALVFLFRTLFAIKKNLRAFDQSTDPWPVREIGRSRPSFGTEDIDAIKDGASWITSEPGSRRQSISTWSFSTHHTGTTSHGRPQSTTQPLAQPKSAHRHSSNTHGSIQIPPVPPLPSPYTASTLTPDGLPDPDPFRREIPTNYKNMKARLGSQSSWLSSSDGSHSSVTAWSFTPSHHEINVPDDNNTNYHSEKDSVRDLQSHDVTPVHSPGLSSAQVLGGYGYTEAEKGTSFISDDSSIVGLSIIPVISWLVTTLLPLGLSLPYLVILSKQSLPSKAVEILFILSVTLSSPLLTFNLLTGSLFPIPVGLFDNDLLPTPVGDSLPVTRWSTDYKRSTSSATVVEGRRSGDVWISKGDAIDGKGKFGRAVTMLAPAPKLSVLPLEEDDGYDMPPIPFENDNSNPVHINGTPHSESSVQFGRFRTESRRSVQSNNASNVSDDSQIMVAQRHYSTLAQTVMFQGQAIGNRDSAGASTLVGGASSGVASKRGSYASHIRTRSISSTKGLYPQSAEREKSISPPPSFPLPPTPPSVRAARLALRAHKKSFSSGISLNELNDMNEIDAMTAGVLPLLIPGLKVGDNMKIKDGDYSPPATLSKVKGLKLSKKLTEFGADFSSPEVHSTPARPQGHKISGHRKNHLSLPSFGLGKEVFHISDWGQGLYNAIETKIEKYTSLNNTEMGRKAAVGSELKSSNLKSVNGENKPNTNMVRTASVGLSADVPCDADSARSAAGLMDVPHSANSDVTLFEDLDAGLQSGPQAESTPHHTVTQKTISRHPPPPLPVAEKRRSTIRYIKSDSTERTGITPTSHETIAEEKPHWSTNVRRVILKANKPSRSPSDATTKERGLRELTLLQDRDNINAQTQTSGRTSPTADIRPLVIGKKQKSRLRPLKLPKVDENGNPTTRNKNVDELSLTRSETAKARGILRKTEVLPEVVVRPPSNSEHHGFGYAFHE